MVDSPHLPLLLVVLALLSSSCSPEDAVVDDDSRRSREGDGVDDDVRPSGEGDAGDDDLRPSGEGDAGDDTPRDADDDTESADAASAPSAPQAPVCEVPHFPDESEPVPFESLRARVVDPDGNPIAGAVAQACGVNLCLNIPGGTLSDGLASLDDEQMLQRAAFKYGDGLRHAQFALLLDARPSHELGDQVTLALPAVETGSTFEPGKTLMSAGVELKLGDDTDVELDLLSFSMEEQVFLAAEFPSDAFPKAASDEALDALFALGPLKTKFCPAAQLRLPNTVGLPSGARVEFLVHSTDVRAEYAPYGSWAKVSEGEVTTDGGSIETAEDGGIPVLGVVGVRVLP